jgi:hypothetical protein
MLKKKNKKKKKKTAAVVANATALKQGSVQCYKFISGLELQSVSGLYKNFTRMSPTEFEYLIHLIFYCSAMDALGPILFASYRCL